MKPATISLASAKGPSVTLEAVTTLPEDFSLLPISRRLALNLSFHSLKAANISCIWAGEGLFWLDPPPRYMHRYFWVGIGLSWGCLRPSVRRHRKMRKDTRIGHLVETYFRCPKVSLFGQHLSEDRPCSRNPHHPQ